MFKLELKRLLRSKEILLLIVCITIIFISNFLLELYFYNGNITNEYRIYNLYNSFSQFMFLVFAPLLGGLFSDDIENNSVYFYLNNGVSIIKYYTYRMITFDIILTIIFSIACFIYGFTFKLLSLKYIIVVLVLILNFIYMISISGVLSLLFRKKVKTSMAIIFCWFIMCIINIIPINAIKGKLFLVDNNSYSSYIINNFLGIDVTTNLNNFSTTGNLDIVYIFMLGIGWIILFNIITYWLLKNNTIKF